MSSAIRSSASKKKGLKIPTAPSRNAGIGPIC
jgi:hypothetical protein